MRVLLLYQFFGPYHLARMAFLRQVAGLQGIDVRGLELFEKPDLYHWTPVDVIENIRKLGLQTAGNDQLRWRDSLTFIWALLSARPDVVVINGWGTRDAILAHLCCRIRQIPRVVVSDSQEVDYQRNSLKEALKRTIIHGVRAAFVAGAPHLRYLLKLGLEKDRVTLGCDVVDNTHFSVARRLRCYKGYRLLTVARFSPEKNLLAAARAFLRFVAQRPISEPWVWQLVGYGPLFAELKHLAAESRGAIRLLGAMNYAELPAVFAEADVYWQPSIRESWALSVNEAMAAGLPVLVSNRCGCFEDFVKPETGWGFNPLDEDDIIKSLHRVAAMRECWQQMGDSAYELIQKWDLPRFADGLIQAAKLATNQDNS